MSSITTVKNPPAALASIGAVVFAEGGGVAGAGDGLEAGGGIVGGVTGAVCGNAAVIGGTIGVAASIA